MTDRIAAVGDRVCVVEAGPLDGAEGVLVELGPYAHEVLLDRDAHLGSGGVRFFTPQELRWLDPEERRPFTMDDYHDMFGDDDD